jgi:hypothetical protein
MLHCAIELGKRIVAEFHKNRFDNNHAISDSKNPVSHEQGPHK